MFEFEYCLLFKGKNVFKLSNLIEDEVVLNVDQDCLATILFMIKMKITFGLVVKYLSFCSKMHRWHLKEQFKQALIPMLGMAVHPICWIGINL